MTIVNHPETWRGDAPLVRYMEKTWGIETARAYQREPFIDFRAEGQLVAASGGDILKTLKTFTTRPFNTFVMECPPTFMESQGPESIRRIWIRVGVIGEMRWGAGKSVLYPWSGGLQGKTIEEFAEEAYASEPLKKQREYKDNKEEIIRRFKQSLIVTIFTQDIHKNFYAEGSIHFHDDNVSAPILSPGLNEHIAQMIMACIALLCSPPEQLVEVTPRAIECKDKGKKIWTRALPTIRMLDLNTVRRVKTIAKGGSHASPVPHPRRGGCAILTHPRWYGNWNTGDGMPIPVPPALHSVFHKSGSFYSGIDNEGHAHVYRKLGDFWYKLETRRSHRSSTYVGEVIEGKDGASYRVI